jgi:DNA-binding MarR family transcriptional regulator
MKKREAIDQLVELFWESVPGAWHRTREVIRDAAAEKFHLTVEQFQVLRRIRRGIASVSSIAKDSRTTRSAVSRAVDGLVHKGLVVRKQDPNDRRNIPLVLTLEGDRIMEAIFNEAEAWLARQFDCLTEEECVILRRGMEQLHKTFAAD